GQHAPGGEPAEEQRGGGGDDEGDASLDQHLPQRRGTFLVADGCDLVLDGRLVARRIVVLAVAPMSLAGWLTAPTGVVVPTPVVERPRQQAVHDRQEQHAGGQEETAVEEGEPEPDGRLGKSHGGASTRR